MEAAQSLPEKTDALSRESDGAHGLSDADGDLAPSGGDQGAPAETGNHSREESGTAAAASEADSERRVKSNLTSQARDGASTPAPGSGWRARLERSAQRALQAALAHVPERAASLAYRLVKRLFPSVAVRIRAELAQRLEALEPQVHPYRDAVETFARLPPGGIEASQIVQWMQRLQQRESAKWEEGYVSGAVYSGEREHTQLMSEVYALFSQTNPLHADVWPSCTKFEAEVVSMTARMLGDVPGVCGTVTSGGTESILLACKTYRDWAQAERGIRHPEMVIPSTAHAAFHKASDYFGIRLRLAEVDPLTWQVKMSSVRRLVNRRTVLLVGSAPQYPHGVIDPIEALSALAQQRGIGLHVDACLGGFVLPWIERLQQQQRHRQRTSPEDAFLAHIRTPQFDFRLPGVTSMSVDTHKYGYAPKGTSVVLYRHGDLRRYQFYVITDWSGGLYSSPTLAGSRSGALIAACWASMVRCGEDGYAERTAAILRTAHRIKTGMAERVPELCILGNPLWVIAFTAADPTALNIYEVMDAMAARGWSLNGLHRPPCVHLCVTLRHCEPGVAERFLRDLRAAVDIGLRLRRRGDTAEHGMAPIYGLGGTIPARGLVRDLLLAYMDLLYQVS
ncbi:hypothetical protein CDCA_CDCA01G0439 [Cyanidium caldarium]|uniref:sphinganine-1-phosphate aldolase n=1 Tax=Cyanidium caldarium TaxID=2771 RepID=A0AAV9IQ94_CYACA|nr:hypothetical protein CDCA_CDCA01G0439 [Cyanidium caldarium]